MTRPRCKYRKVVSTVSKASVGVSGDDRWAVGHPLRKGSSVTAQRTLRTAVSSAGHAHTASQGDISIGPEGTGTLPAINLNLTARLAAGQSG